MSMGNYACYADTIEESFVEEVCPKELKNLKEILKKYEYGLEYLGQVNYPGCDIHGELSCSFKDNEAIEIGNAYEILCARFEEETSLDLEIRYHEAEDRGDEVNGYFWEVNGVYVLSIAGEKYKDKIDRKFWTEWG